MNMLSFNIIDAIGKQLLDGLRSVLEHLFGTSVAPLFDNFAANIVPFLLEAGLNLIIQVINMSLYNLFLMLLFLLDMVAFSFDIFIGMEDIIIDTTTNQRGAMFNIFFNDSGISRAFWGITMIAMVLCVLFTIVAVVRSMADLDIKRPVGKILGLCGKSMITFLLIPFLCIAALNLSSVVLEQSAQAISGQTTSHKVSIGTQIFTAVSQGAMRHQAIQPAEAATEIYFKFLTSAFAILTLNPMPIIMDTIMVAWLAITSISSNSVANAVSGDPSVWLETSPGMRHFEYLVVNQYNRQLNTPEGSAKMRELITQLFNNGGVFNDNALDPKFMSAVSIATEELGFGRMPYMDTAYVSQFIKPHLVNSFIGIICTFMMLIFMIMAAFIFARRIFELILLYIVSPYFAATIPLDDGKKFESWRTQFIGKLLSGYGIVFSMRIFLLIVPIIFTPSVRFTYVPIVDALIRMLLLIAVCASILKAHTLIGKIVGGESSAEAEAGKVFNMAVSPVTSVAGAIHKSTMNAVGQGVQSAIKPGINYFSSQAKSHLNNIFGFDKTSKKGSAEKGSKGRSGGVGGYPQLRRARGRTILPGTAQAPGETPSRKRGGTIIPGTAQAPGESPSRKRGGTIIPGAAQAPGETPSRKRGGTIIPGTAQAPSEKPSGGKVAAGSGVNADKKKHGTPTVGNRAGGGSSNKVYSTGRDGIEYYEDANTVSTYTGGDGIEYYGDSDTGSGSTYTGGDGIEYYGDSDTGSGSTYTGSDGIEYYGDSDTGGGTYTGGDGIEYYGDADTGGGSTYTGGEQIEYYGDSDTGGGSTYTGSDGIEYYGDSDTGGGSTYTGGEQIEYYGDSDTGGSYSNTASKQPDPPSTTYDSSIPESARRQTIYRSPVSQSYPQRVQNNAPSTTSSSSNNVPSSSQSYQSTSGPSSYSVPSQSSGSVPSAGSDSPGSPAPLLGVQRLQRGIPSNAQRTVIYSTQSRTLHSNDIGGRLKKHLDLKAQLVKEGKKVEPIKNLFNNNKRA